MKKYISYLLIFGSLFMYSSCMEDRTVLWEGIQVEFAQATGGSAGVYLRLGDGSTASDFVRINLVAAHQTTPVSVSWAVDPASTAIEGVHYNLISPSPIAIPAGESWVDVQFEVIADNVEPGETLDLVFTLNNSDVDIAENEKTVTHTIAISCPSDLAGTYDAVMSGTYGSGGTNSYSDLASTVTLTPVSGVVGAYDIDDMSFGVYADIYDDAAPAGSIRDLCRDISGYNSPVDQYADPFTFSGTVNLDGTIDISWSNTWGDSGTGVLTPQ